MTIGVSGSSSKSKSKSDNTLDPWAQAQIESVLGPAKDLLSGVTAQPYGGPLGAELDPLQHQATQMAQNNIGAGQGQLGQATGIASGVGSYTPQNVTAGTIAGTDLSAYMNPWTDSVINSGLDKLNRAREMSIVGNSQAAGPGAWGGSRHGVADSLTNENFLDQAGSFISNLLSGGYDRATTLAGQDIGNTLNASLANQNAGLQGAGLNLNAADSLAGFGQQQQNMGLADVNAINTLGQQAQGTTAQNNQLNYEEWLRQQNLPIELAGAYGSLLGGIPAIVDNKSKGSQSGTSASVGFKYSDARLKRDVEHVLTDAKGRHWFDFRYVWQDDDEPKQRGVMAQQILKTDPHAVTTDPASGYLKVDYGALA